MLLFTACSGSSEESATITYDQQETDIVTDSVSFEMEELKEDIVQTLDELENLLDEID